MTFAVDLKFGVVVVREVPALFCTQCGDAWIDGPVAAKLEGIVAEARWSQLAANALKPTIGQISVEAMAAMEWENTSSKGRLPPTKAAAGG